MQDFRKLQVWQLSRSLVVKLYRATGGFPKSELYGLTSQIRRAAGGIGAGIAEGCGRGSTADTLRFFQMSFSTSTELLHHLITAFDLGFVSQQEFAVLERDLDEIRRKLAKLMSRLRDNH
jgi:four helix bundle protein